MKKRHPCYFLIGGGVLAIAAILFASIRQADAHIIPPEKYHPVAEAYRRMTFALNLNPVRWDLVKKDADTIIKDLAAVEPKEAETYRREVTALIQKCTAPTQEDPPGAAVRKETARKVFELCTYAVAEVLTLRLQEAEKSLTHYARASRAYNEARQIWASFEHEVKATDKTAFTKLGECWLEMASALGSPGVLQVGYVAADTSKFREEAKEIVDYVTANFGKDFRAPKNGSLVPLPQRSATFDPKADVPIKLPPGTNINKQVPRPRQILGMAARGVSETETPLIAIGDMAFDSAYIFGEPARSLGITCNTCHNKGVTNPQFFIPGLSARPGGMDVSNSFFEPQANNGHFGHLDTPDLRGIRATAPYGRNGRTASLREFVRNVIVLEFNGPEPDPMLVDGMVAYMNEFEFLPNPYLNPDGTLTAKASAAAKRGERIFNTPFKGMGNRSCATCHVPSDHFLDRKRHNIGTAGGFAPHSLDRALDTPTLLSAKYTPPYFHDGSQPTLRAVNEWFNNKFKLGLSKQQIDALTAYVETVGEGVEAYEDSPYYLDAEMEEFSFFLSAYEFLKGQGKWDLIKITFRTVASEIRNHKWELQDDSHRPTMERLADILDEAYDAVDRKDYDPVDKKVAEYRKLYEENVEKLK